jgi:hypothetical protein
VTRDKDEPGFVSQQLLDEAVDLREVDKVLQLEHRASLGCREDVCRFVDAAAAN